MAMTEALARGVLDELNFHFAPQVVLFTALKLGIFEAIAEGTKDAEGLASATQCSPRGVRMLLNCMASMGLVEKEKEMYGLNDLSRDRFLPSSRNYLGSLFICSDQLLKLWLNLPQAVKSGRPPLALLPNEERERLNLDIVEALFHVHKASAWELAALFRNDLSSAREEKIKILDIAAGSAVWSIPFALQWEGAEVTAIDFAPVLELAKRFTREFEVQGRYKFVSADIREIEFGAEGYDLALLGHICHSEGAAWSQRLIAKCFRALRKNGRLFIMDYVADEDRRSELMPLLVALNALLGTEEGDTFAFSQYREWLWNVGYSEVRTMQVDDRSPVIMGLKR